MWGQQQAWANQQQGQQQFAQAGTTWQQPQAAAATNNKDVTLVVTGCTHGTVGPIIRGTFQLLGENHGKPTYKKDGQVNGLDVMSYYWDERDGPGFCGWWFGPVVGGDQVWAYHTDKTSPMPPQSGWKVPYDGAVDSTLAIQYKPKAAAAPAQQAWGAQGQQQQQGGWGQQQQQGGWGQQQQQQNGYGQQQQNGNSLTLQQMRQQQAMTQQQKMEENKNRLQQANQQRMEEQKKKMEEMRKQQEMLIQQRAHDQKQKEAEMAGRKKEQVSVLNVRRVLQKFRSAIPEKFDEIKAELDETLQKEMDALGSQKDRLVQEVEMATSQMKTKIEQINEIKKKEAEKKEVENNRRRELKAKAIKLLEDLGSMVEKAEASSKGVVEEAEPLVGENTKELRIAEIEACASAVEEAGKDATEQLKSCNEFVTKESANIKNCPPIPGEPAATCGQDLAKLVGRIKQAQQSTSTTLGKVNQAKTLSVRKAHAKEKFDKSFSVFKKFDQDKDGKLSRREIQAYAKGEFSFQIPVETLDNICNIMIKPGSKGVDKEHFHKLRVMIGVAREKAIDVKKKQLREKRESELEKLKEKVKADVEKTSELIKAAAEAVSETEKEAAPLNAPKIEKTASEMVAMAEATDKIIEKTNKRLSTARDGIKALAPENSEPELKGFIMSEVKQLNNSLNPLEQKMAKAAASAKRFRENAAKKNSAELEKLRADGLQMIFFHQGAKKLLSEGVYALFDKKKKGKVEEGAFVSFFKTCEMKDESDERMSEEDASRLFNFLDDEDMGHMTKAKFSNLIRRFMKVVKASVMTEDTSTKSKPMRRLNEGEILECLSGPTPIDGEEISRIKVKAVLDDLEGWVTPVGNRGTVFVEDGGNTFKVVKQTILTGSFDMNADSKDKAKDRQLKVGELLEVLEWAKKEETTGLMRMKVKVKSDGQIGWCTSVGNTGITFVESV